MDAYGDVRYQIEGLKANMQTVFDSILLKHPEVRLEIESAREELEDQIGVAEKTEKEYRKILDSMIESYLRDNPVGKKDVIKSKFLTVSATSKITYDPVGLDGYALSNPSILGFRNEETKTVVRIRPLGS